jgi:hypothetical protein
VLSVPYLVGGEPLTVFVSYASGDERYVQHFAQALNRIDGAEPFVPRHDPESIKRIRKELDGCRCVVAIIGTSSNDGWQDQEIGYAIARKKDIVLIKEKSVALRGFLQGSGYIVLRPDDLEFNTYELFARIGDIFRGLRVKVRCGSCNHHFQILVPNQKSINNAIAHNLMFSADCPKCYGKVGVEPKTLTCVEMRPEVKYRPTEFGFGYY